MCSFACVTEPHGVTHSHSHAVAEAVSSYIETWISLNDASLPIARGYFMYSLGSNNVVDGEVELIRHGFTHPSFTGPAHLRAYRFAAEDRVTEEVGRGHSYAEFVRQLKGSNGSGPSTSFAAARNNINAAHSSSSTTDEEGVEPPSPIAHSSTPSQARILLRTPSSGGPSGPLPAPIGLLRASSLFRTPVRPIVPFLEGCGGGVHARGSLAVLGKRVRANALFEATAQPESVGVSSPAYPKKIKTHQDTCECPECTGSDTLHPVVDGSGYAAPRQISE